MNTDNLSTLKIHKLTQTQYDRELEAGNIDASALYLTPEELASEDTDGLMSSNDKIKLDNYEPTRIILHQGTSSLPTDVIENAILIAYDA